MNVTLRKVGNSQAVIIPKAILLQLKLTDTLDMEVIENKIILSKPTPKKREGWALAASEISQANDDELVLDFIDENEGDWEW